MHNFSNSIKKIIEVYVNMFNYAFVFLEQIYFFLSVCCRTQKNKRYLCLEHWPW